MFNYGMSQCGMSIDAEAFCELQIWFDRIWQTISWYMSNKIHYLVTDEINWVFD